MLPSQCSRMVRPSAARTRRAMGGSVASNPVPRMIVSTGCSTPSEVTTACGRTSVIDSVTTSVLGRATAGKYSLDSSTRLQPSA